MKKYGPLSPVSVSTKVLTATAIAIAVILLGSSFTVIDAQQQLTSGTGEIDNTAGTGATPFQSTSDSFSIQVPNGWIVADLNNTGFELSEELRRGYGLLAELCPEQEQGAQALSAGAASAANSTTTNNRCQGAQEVVHVIRYPDQGIRMQPTGNLTEYHLQKLQDVGYGNVQITSTRDVAVNLTNPLTNETIQTVPAEFADITFTTTVSPNQTRTGHYILASTNNTAPNATATKGYAVFYEGTNSGGTNNTSGAAAITPTTSISSALSPQVAQMLDSFELIATPEAAETLAEEAAAEPAEFTDDTADEEVEEEEEDDGDDNDGDDNDGDDNDGDDNDGDDNDGDDNDDNNVPSPDECINIGGGNTLDDCDITTDANDDDDDDDNDGGGGGDNDGA
jgi:hypothetical protein